MRDIQKAYQEGIRCKGFTITPQVGVTDVNLPLSGFAKTFLGLAVQPGASSGTRVSLIINNDVVIENVDVDFFEVTSANPRQYFDFVRPLTGTDTITFRVEVTTATPFQLLVYFQNKSL